MDEKEMAAAAAAEAETGDYRLTASSKSLSQRKGNGKILLLKILLHTQTSFHERNE